MAGVIKRQRQVIRKQPCVSDDESTIPCELSDQEDLDNISTGKSRSMRSGRLSREELLKWKFCYTTERKVSRRARQKRKRRRKRIFEIEQEEEEGGREEEVLRPWITGPQDLLRVTLKDILGASALLDFSVELLQVRIRNIGPSELHALMGGLPRSPFAILNACARPQFGTDPRFDIVVGLKEEEDAVLGGCWRPRATGQPSEVTACPSSSASELDRVLTALNQNGLNEPLNIGDELSISSPALNDDRAALAQETQPLAEMSNVLVDAFDFSVIRPSLDDVLLDLEPEDEKDSSEGLLSFLPPCWGPKCSKIEESQSDLD